MARYKPISAKEHKDRVDDFIKKKMKIFLEVLQQDKKQKWTKPWKDISGGLSRLPHNPVTQHKYKGSNTLFLMLDMMLNKWADPRFMTLSQAKRYADENNCNPKDVRIKKGSKANYILQPITFKVRDKDKKDNNFDSKERESDLINNMMRDNSSIVNQNAVKTFIYFKTVPRFNAEQLTGIPKLGENQFEERTWDHNAIIEQFIASCNIDMQEGSHAAFYPKSDYIEMPQANSFSDSAMYSSVLLHEIFHWTGGGKRENRNLQNTDKIEYAKEEIRAQMFMFSASALLDIPIRIEQEVSYVELFKEKGQLDYKAVFTEFKAASRMFSDVFVPFVIGEQPTVSWFPDKATWPPRCDRVNQMVTNAQSVIDSTPPTHKNNPLGIDVFDVAHRPSSEDIFNQVKIDDELSRGMH